MNAVDNMSYEELKECLGILYDMELNNYLMQRGHSQIMGRAKQLGHKPTRYPPKKQPNNTDGMDITWGTMCITATIGALFGGLSSCSGGDNLVEQVFSLFDVFGGLLGGGLIGGLIGIPIGIVASIIASKAKDEENQEIYEAQYREYQSILREDDARCKTEINQRNMLYKQAEILKARQTEATKKLNEFYAMSGIDKKFHNIVAIGYMYEFVRLGIARKTEGADGLYYLTMKELKAEQFLYTLQDISLKLDTIIDQNREIYSELVSMNQKCNKMISSVDHLVLEAARTNKSIAENTSIAIYNSERIGNELAYQNRMMELTRRF